jgi:hypothetical protein
MPTVAVNRGGIVGVAWYDRREHPDNLGWDVRFTASLDGGATFLPSVKVSSRGTTFGPRTPWTGLRPFVSRDEHGLAVRVSLNSFTFLGGDTAGLVADATGVFHPVWVDNRTGTPQVWTATVTVEGGLARGVRRRPARARSGEVAPPPPESAPRAERAEPAPATPRTEASAPVAAEDLSSDVTLAVTETSYDRTRNVLTVIAHLENTSAERLEGPFRLRAVDLQSELGDPAIANADNGRVGAGAEWVVADSVLAPGATSQERVLRFALSNLRPFRTGHRYRLGLLDLHVVVTHAER